MESEVPAEGSREDRIDGEVSAKSVEADATEVESPSAGGDGVDIAGTGPDSDGKQAEVVTCAEGCNVQNMERAKESKSENDVDAHSTSESNRSPPVVSQATEGTAPEVPDMVADDVSDPAQEESVWRPSFDASQLVAADSAAADPSAVSGELDGTGVGEAVEDPPVVVRGLGSGAECQAGVPSDWVSSAVEDPPLVVAGLGWGALCQVGNGVRARRRGGRLAAGSNGHPEPARTRQSEKEPPTRKQCPELQTEPNQKSGGGDSNTELDDKQQSEVSSGLVNESERSTETDAAKEEKEENADKDKKEESTGENKSEESESKYVEDQSKDKANSSVGTGKQDTDTDEDKDSTELNTNKDNAEPDAEKQSVASGGEQHNTKADTGKLDEEVEDDGKDNGQAASAPAGGKKRGRKRRAEMLDTAGVPEPEPETGVTRRSSRVARLREREEQQRRVEEEERLRVLKEQAEMRKLRVHEREQRRAIKKDKKKKRREKKAKLDDDDDDDQPLAQTTTPKKKKKRKKKKKTSSNNPWLSSSCTSSSSSDEELDEMELFAHHEEDGDELVFRSDHEFSPESDNDQEYVPVQHARTARSKRKQPAAQAPASSSSSSEEAVEHDDEDLCKKCGSGDHPELILLCDGCDCGWHTNCVRPPLLSIPEGNWYCPPCEHVSG